MTDSQSGPKDPDSQEVTVSFTPLEPALVKPSLVPGKQGATLQFVIPSLRIAGPEASAYQDLVKRCSEAVEHAVLVRAESKEGRDGTIVSVAFHLEPKASQDETHDEAERIGFLITERFVGVMTFAAGEKLSAIQRQVQLVFEGGRFIARLNPIGKRSKGTRQMQVPPASLLQVSPNGAVFDALFWLRRGMAERDPLETYAALMVCLQKLAEMLVRKEERIQKCVECRTELSCPKCGRRPHSVTHSVKKLVVEKLGGSEKRFRQIWKARNAVVAHGNKPVDTKTLVEVGKLRLEVARLVFRGIKLAMNLNPDGLPSPSQFFSVAPAFMHVD